MFHGTQQLVMVVFANFVCLCVDYMSSDMFKEVVELIWVVNEMEM